MSRFISPPQNILDSEVVLPAGTMTILSLAVGQSTGTYSISIISAVQPVRSDKRSNLVQPLATPTTQ
jgi:hypothetical protein